MSAAPNAINLELSDVQAALGAKEVIILSLQSEIKRLRAELDAVKAADRDAVNSITGRV